MGSEVEDDHGQWDIMVMVKFAFIKIRRNKLVRKTALQSGSVLGGWVQELVMAWVRQHSAPNVVGARKLKALIFYTISALLYEKRSLCVFSHSWGGGLRGNVRCSS